MSHHTDTLPCTLHRLLSAPAPGPPHRTQPWAPPSPAGGCQLGPWPPGAFTLFVLLRFEAQALSLVAGEHVGGSEGPVLQGTCS